MFKLYAYFTDIKDITNVLRTFWDFKPSMIRTFARSSKVLWTTKERDMRS